MSRSLPSRSRLIRMLARQSTGPARRMLRPLVLGPTILRRPAGGQGPWLVDLADDAGLTPHIPGSRLDTRRIMAMHVACGQTCRLALALAAPIDAPGARPAGQPEAAATSLPDIYGWALLYQPAGHRGTAFVDPHDGHPDLPAFFECPLEFLDRTAYLASKGISHRPLALVTCVEDFEQGNGRHPRRNRYFPDSRFRTPVDLARLA